MESVGDWGSLLRETAYWLRPAQLRARAGRVPVGDTLRQLDRLAFGVLPLLAVVLFFVGMILALQLATILKLLGVVEYVPDIVAVSMVREMAPLLTGVVLSGYAGAAMAAEIGSMKVNEELEAMEALSLPPVRMLVAPRFLAAAIAGPFVAIFACYIGILGGLLVGATMLGLSPVQYLHRSLDALNLTAVSLGVIKGEVFALLVVAIATFEGLRVRGGAMGVGRATTAAVVKSIIAIIAADLLLTVLFFNIT
ncbi:MAG: MlaE family ABC transporter permease [Planctomycetota bacterium]